MTAHLNPTFAPTLIPTLPENQDDAAIDDVYFESYSKSKYYPHEGNSTITTSVTIHVTPDHYYLRNWALLWGGYVLAILFASCHIRKERRHPTVVARQRNPSANQPGRSVRDANLSQSTITHSPHMDAYGSTEGGEVSSGANMTRRRFRELLLVAMLCRTIMMPVQTWAGSLWAQCFADTLPEMAFASAWTLLVSFFVQLVGVASGTGVSTIPGLVFQVTAYVIYSIVFGTFLWNPVASVLLYTMLCCIYAVLFGTALFYCTRLMILLRPTLQQQKRGLAIRLVCCSLVCLFVFGARTFGFARKLVAPPASVSWWWQYGCLELIPAVILMLIINPKSEERPNGGNSASQTDSNNNQHPSPHGLGSVSTGSRGTSPASMGPRHSSALQRQDSYGSSQRRGRSNEATPLLIPSSGGYRAATFGSSDNA
eukprot:Nitzschia sp. Nitz4//scaffold241_size29735//11610//13002//NITZ4_008026-RA/size29735-augustus-gene-0.15-mRNA-1//1//CDS//3329543775//9057//frame0